MSNEITKETKDYIKNEYLKDSTFTVGQLIEELQKMNKDAIVAIKIISNAFMIKNEQTDIKSVQVGAPVYKKINISYEKSFPEFMKEDLGEKIVTLNLNASEENENFVLIKKDCIKDLNILL